MHRGKVSSDEFMRGKFTSIYVEVINCAISDVGDQKDCEQGRM